MRELTPLQPVPLCIKKQRACTHTHTHARTHTHAHTHTHTHRHTHKHTHTHTQTHTHTHTHTHKHTRTRTHTHTQFSWLESVEDSHAKRVRVEPSFFPSAEKAQLPLHRCMRFLPHHQDTGGFFVAVLQKVCVSMHACV